MDRLEAKLILGLLVLVAAPAPASAGSILGDTGKLISPASEAQLEAWLGQGPVTLTDIFTKSGGGGSSAAAFHAAVDRKGPTISVWEATAGGSTYVVGGYDPVSWNSTDEGFTYVGPDADRTAFIFNLTSGTIQREQLSTVPGGSSNGAPQVANFLERGPDFGGGDDLAVVSSNKYLFQGYAYQSSYGAQGSGGLNILGGTGLTPFDVGSLEVFTISAAVPEPGSLLLVAAGVTIAMLRRRGVRGRLAARRSSDPSSRRSTMRMTPLVALFIFVSAPRAATAGTVIGDGGNLISPSSEAQIESWLGQGPITLTNIFTKTSVLHYASDFHAAVDGRGPTISIWEATVDGGTTTQVVGGYDPLSWNQTGNGSIPHWNVVYPDADRTAFLFNLTSDVVQREKLIADSPYWGEWQTSDYPWEGPGFGAGNDIVVDMNGPGSGGYLDRGVASQITYGTAPAQSFGTNILGGTGYNQTYFNVGKLEVFAISSYVATAPEPSSLALAAVLATLSMRRRRS